MDRTRSVGCGATVSLSRTLTTLSPSHLLSSSPPHPSIPVFPDYRGTDALIYVVDSHDVDRMDLARDELTAILDAPEMAAAKVLVLANKQDLPRALPPSEVAERMGLHKLRRDWYIQGCQAVTGDGLYEGLDWVADRVEASS